MVADKPVHAAKDYSHEAMDAIHKKAEGIAENVRGAVTTAKL